MSDCPTCPYCDLGAASDLIYENDFVTVLIHPENFVTGELLVVSRDHVPSLRDMLDLEVHAVMETAIALARAVREATACKGIRLEQVEKDIHYHVRLIPLFNTPDAFHVHDPQVYIDAVRGTLYSSVL